jgi:hypothetical protein
MKRLPHRNKWAAYSVTSSAINCISRLTVRPSEPSDPRHPARHHGKEKPIMVGPALFPALPRNGRERAGGHDRLVLRRDSRTRRLPTPTCRKSRQRWNSLFERE